MFNVRVQFTTVAEDIEHLRDDWLKSPRNDVVRRGSVILRRLLAEGVLQRAWKEYGFPNEPTIVAPRLEALIEAHPHGLRCATAGGAIDGGIQIAGVASFIQQPEHALDAFDPEHRFGLRAFIESASVAIGRHILKRREVVKYFAHVEGGAHLRLSSRVRRSEEALVRAVEKWTTRDMILERDALYFELLSIGQAVGKAEDAQRLVAAIRASAAPLGEPAT